MKQFAIVLFASSVALMSVAAERPKPLIEALLRVPVPPATKMSGGGSAVALTGDEPIDVLDGYVVTQSPLITAAVRNRVTARLADEPEILPMALLLLPETDAAAAAAWTALQKLPAKLTGGDEYKKVRLWLRRHGAYFRNDLAAAARSVKDREGYVEGQEDLEAYARLDWPNAEPILSRLAAGQQPRAAALAHAILYGHHLVHDTAAAAAERAALRAIAEDRSAPARARDLAFEALMQAEWPGSTEWYLAQFADPSLLEATDGHYLLSPLASVVDRAPDAWIPRVAPLTRSKDRVIRSNAVNVLSDFHLENARADALRPLVPWLSDPQWTDDRGMGRLRLIQSVARLGLREAIPGLRWICNNDPDESMRVYAAEALLDLNAPNAMDDVRTVLAKSSDAMGRHELEQTIVRSGVLSDEEIVQALTAYASLASTAEGRKQLSELPIGGDTPSWLVTVGARLARKLPNRESLALLLLESATRGDAAGKLIARIVSTMDVPAVHKRIVKRLVTADAALDEDPFPLVSLLEHRQHASRSASAELQAAVEKGGAARGIAAVVLNDNELITAILRSGSADERGAVLAAARLVRQPLAVADVLEAATNAKEAAAAELEMMNTAETRVALARLYPGEARIWGSRPWADPGHTTFTFFDQWEESLRTLLKSRKFDRIDALARGSYWQGNGEVVIIARAGEAVYLMTSATDAKSRPVARATALRIRKLLDEMSPADLEPFDGGAFDGVQYDYVYLTPDGGRRVFMNNPSSDKRDPYGRLVDTLSNLAEQ